MTVAFCLAKNRFSAFFGFEIVCIYQTHCRHVLECLCVCVCVCVCVWCVRACVCVSSWSGAGSRSGSLGRSREAVACEFWNQSVFLTWLIGWCRLFPRQPLEKRHRRSSVSFFSPLVRPKAQNQCCHCRFQRNQKDCDPFLPKCHCTEFCKATVLYCNRGHFCKRLIFVLFVIFWNLWKLIAY